MQTYSVRVDFQGGMEVLDVTAKSRLDVFPHVVRLLKIKARNGVHRVVTAITILPERGKSLAEIL